MRRDGQKVLWLQQREIRGKTARQIEAETRRNHLIHHKYTRKSIKCVFHPEMTPRREAQRMSERNAIRNKQPTGTDLHETLLRFAKIKFETFSKIFDMLKLKCEAQTR